MTDQSQRLEVATVKAEVGSNILYRFSNDPAANAEIPTDGGAIPNLKQVILQLQEDGAEKISFATTIYPTTAAGIAATTNGAIFLVKSAAPDEIYAVYSNTAGMAVDTGKRALSSQAVEDAMLAATEAADAAQDSADIATARTARFLASVSTAPTIRDDGTPLQIGDRYVNTTDQAEYIYKTGGWVVNESMAAIADLENGADPLKGAALVGWDNGTVSEVMSQFKPLAGYSALRAYVGIATRVQLTDPGVSGVFKRRAKTVGEAEVIGITILSTDGLFAWDRDFGGNIEASWFGVVAGDSIGRYKSQLQLAVNYASVTKGKLEVAGDIYLEAGFTVPSTTEYHLDFSKASLIFDDAAPFGVIVGTAGSNPFRGTIDGISISKASVGTGDIGIWLLNCVESSINDPIVKRFSKSMAFAPSGASRVAYNKINNPAFSDHQYGVWVAPADGSSYANENTVTAGRLASYTAGRLIDHVYLSNASGSGAQHNRFIGVSIEGFSGSGSCGKSAVRAVSGAHQNVFEFCRTEKYNSGWDDGSYVFDATTIGNLVIDTRSDVSIVDAGSNNWWTPITGFRFSGFATNQAATPAFKYTRPAPLSDPATKFAIDLADTYSASGEVGLLRYSSARGGGTLIDVTTTLGSLQMNGACEWTTQQTRSGATTGAVGHAFSVSASVAGATLSAAYHSAKNAAVGSWAFYGEGTAPSYFGGLVRTLGALTVTPSTATTKMLAFSNTSSNTGDVAAEYNTNNVAARHHMSFSNPNGVVGSISTTASATSFNTSSDIRLKDNIEDAEDSGHEVDSIQVRQFDWKAGGHHQKYGFIAQELIKVAPYAVTASDDDEASMMSVDYSKLVPLLVKEIQSLRRRIEILEA